MKEGLRGGAVIVIVHLVDATKPVLNTKAGDAVDLKAYTRRAAAAVLLPPSLQFRDNQYSGGDEDDIGPQPMQKVGG